MIKVNTGWVSDDNGRKERRGGTRVEALFEVRESRKTQKEDPEGTVIEVSERV